MEQTADIKLNVSVRSAAANTPNANTPNSSPGATTVTPSTEDPATGFLPDTGASVYLMGGVMLLLILGGALLIALKKRRQGWGIKRSPRGGFLAIALTLLAGVSAWGVISSVSAAPVMELSAAKSEIGLNIDKEKSTVSQSVTDNVALSANSSSGYVLDATIASNNASGNGLNVSVSGGDLANATTLSQGSKTRLLLRNSPDAQLSMPLSLTASTDSTIADGDYEVVVRLTLKPTPSEENAQNIAGVSNLMSAGLNNGDLAKLTNYTESSDDVKVLYKVADSLPSNEVLKRISAPLSNGKYAVPQALNTKLPSANKAECVNQFIEVGKTYVNDGGTNLIWDPSRLTPVHGVVVNKEQTAPYALTCSSFVNMALHAWKYNDTTYVKDTNTASYDWGIKDYDRPAGVDLPFQAWKLLKWYYWQNRAAMHTSGATDYEAGDILFFSKQDPEGAGTGGKYFMNVYHTGIYIGNGKIMQSYGRSTPTGVVIEDFNDTLKKDLSFIARPNLCQ